MPCLAWLDCPLKRKREIVILQPLSSHVVIVRRRRCPEPRLRKRRHREVPTSLKLGKAHNNPPLRHTHKPHRPPIQPSIQTSQPSLFLLRARFVVVVVAAILSCALLPMYTPPPAAVCGAQEGERYGIVGTAEGEGAGPLLVPFFPSPLSPFPYVCLAFLTLPPRLPSPLCAPHEK